MSKIKTLDTHLTNMIAAGEVVERPAGIVKELVENSIDAGATQITIKVNDGGMSYIEVMDNGIGIDYEDIPKAFERHSTSKINTAQDLSAITSFGFRGEALPSIASVSLVRLTTNNGSESYEYVVDNGISQEIIPTARNKGTTIVVSDLFLKTPARLKYIKNTNYESALILDIIQKFAVSHPEISFTYYKDDKLSYRSFGTGQLIDVFQSIYGGFITEDTKIFEGEDFDFNISGLVALPQHNRSNRHSIWIYLNGRMIRYPKIQKAIIDSYRHHLPVDRYPIAIINITVSPQLVDVNVHPSKWEIRLSKESELITLIDKTIQSTLFSETKAPKVKIEKFENIQFESKDLFNTINKPTIVNEPVMESKPIVIEENVIEKPITEDVSVKEIEVKPIIKEEIIEEKPIVKKANVEYLEVLSQFDGKYILARGDQGLYIIDQHAAMERIRYEYFTDKLLNNTQSMQDVVIPFTFEGRGKLVEQIEQLNNKTNDLNLEFEVLDATTLILRSIPTWIKDKEIYEFVNKVLDTFDQDYKLDEETFRRKTIATLACHSSVRFNEYLSQSEMVKLVEDLRYCNQPYHCPHGRPTMIVLDHKHLFKEFMR